MSDTGIIIIGAGLAGLSAGRALLEEGEGYTILESCERPGGLCRTETIDGYSFDYTGHLLHLREGKSREMILDLLGDRLEEHTRRASVLVEGTFVPYPIQANFGKLPSPLAKKCMDDLLKVSGLEVSPEISFPDWAKARFGDTLAEIFMIPYNTKLYAHPLEEMEISWTSWSVPKPTLEEIEAVASGRGKPSFGYNATFFYPRSGGIETLVEALCLGQKERIRTGARVARVNTVDRTVTLDDGETIAYRHLVSTMPLPDLIRICEGLPENACGTAGRLRYSSVLGICMGFDGPILRDEHWIYFPDSVLPFYRIGFPSNFSKGVAPEGCGSLYAEVAYLPGKSPDADSAAREVTRSLREYGIIGRGTKPVVRVGLDMPCAYVFHDPFRARNLESLRSGLRELDILSVGRYGAWEYSGMQAAVQWGLDAAMEITS